ncbi:MAG: DUF3318 domain-containing protein [Cyanobacteria bacterium J06632_22]
MASPQLEPNPGLNLEIPRLRDLLPATGRMTSRIVSNSRQPEVIKTPFPKPWKSSHPVLINFDLWPELSEPQRDLLFLREVSWLSAVRLIKIDAYQGVAAAGALGFLVELVQFDAIGAVSAGGLTALAGVQIWRNSRGKQAEIDADDVALKVAQRRGYTLTAAAMALQDAIEQVAQLEHRPGLSFVELMRCQNLRSYAIATPESTPRATSPTTSGQNDNRPPQEQP